MTYKNIEYSLHDDGRIARIVLNRPEVRNAQNRELLIELDEAFGRAQADDGVRVVVLAGAGPTFSAGHDLSTQALDDFFSGTGESHPSFRINGGSLPGVEGRMRQEWHYFFENTLRWRNLRKITIAEVQGHVLAAGLMLAWCCDLIVAARGTVFADIVGARLGMCGLEYFAHPWELGPRKAKELLLTGDSIDADEAHQLGMISKVFEAESLTENTMAFARRIAALPSVTSLLIKESVNQATDLMGFTNALNAAFSIHTINHSHWAELNDGIALDTSVIPNSGESWPPLTPSRRDTPGGADG